MRSKEDSNRIAAIFGNDDKSGTKGKKVLGSLHIGARQPVLMEIVFQLTDKEYKLRKDTVVQGDDGRDRRQSQMERCIPFRQEKPLSQKPSRYSHHSQPVKALRSWPLDLIVLYESQPPPSFAAELNTSAAAGLHAGPTAITAAQPFVPAGYRSQSVMHKRE